MNETARHIRRLEFDDCALASSLFGPHDSHVKLVSDLSGVSADTRGTSLVLRSDNETSLDAAANLMAQLYGLVKSGRQLSPQDVDQGWRIVSHDSEASLRAIFADIAIPVSRKRTITPKTPTQRAYLEAIREHDMVFGIGPAGTGKTYLAVAMAVAALNARKVKRLVLTRPAVEAGEKLGFLPGDLVEKVNPYLRPLYDALHDMLEFGKVQEMLETGIIEVAPLAFMRGRTLNDAFIILDEAQNTTIEQMKMFLTRLGFGSKVVVTGDVTQIDLPGKGSSGLIHARKVLAGIPGISMIAFQERDVIRHPLVGRIVNAYERHAHAIEEKS
ncbi:PhoH family protein [Desulfocurvibacter africanus]|uniref:PhoH family protein n=1 Tax=Desulfocurvibacter africanus TaxID=873 RepID=UPI002FDA8C6D